MQADWVFFFSVHLALLNLTLHALLFFAPSHFQEESPLSVSSPECIGTWLHYTSGVGTGRRRRRSGEQITSSPVSPKSLAFTSSIFGSWQQVFKLYFIKHFMHSKQQLSLRTSNPLLWIVSSNTFHFFKLLAKNVWGKKSKCMFFHWMCYTLS